MAINTFKTFVKDLTGRHQQGQLGNIFLFTSPRSGSSWLAETLARQPGMKYVNEPFDLRRDDVRHYLGMTHWEELYSNSARESIQEYIDFFVQGGRGSNFCSPSLRSEFHHVFSNRIVFKILHACENQIEWLRQHYSAHVIFLIRHPMAVSLSREETPRLHAFLESDYAGNLSAAELDYAHDIVAKGNALHCKVLDWCLQNAVPLRQRKPEWIVLSYEQLVENPLPVMELLSRRLSLQPSSSLSSNFSKPSASTYKSDSETQRKLAEGDSERQWLLSKWKKKVSDEEERSAMAIVEFFGIDCYRYGSVKPSGLDLPQS